PISSRSNWTPPWLKRLRAAGEPALDQGRALRTRPPARRAWPSRPTRRIPRRCRRRANPPSRLLLSLSSRSALAKDVGPEGRGENPSIRGRRPRGWRETRPRALGALRLEPERRCGRGHRSEVPLSACAPRPRGARGARADARPHGPPAG